MEGKDFYCDFVLNNQIEVKKEIETSSVLSFHHTNPSWTFHVVVIPKQHISQIITVDDMSLFKEIFSVIKEIILKYKLDEINYKVITNGGDFQDSMHLHFHLVSGEPILKK